MRACVQRVREASVTVGDEVTGRIGRGVLVLLALGIVGTFRLAMAREVAGWMEGDGRFEIVAPVNMSLICFRRKGDNARTQRLLERLNAERTAFFGQNVIQGKFALRWAIGNIHTTRRDLEETWAMVRRLR